MADILDICMDSMAHRELHTVHIACNGHTDSNHMDLCIFHNRGNGRYNLTYLSL